MKTIQNLNFKNKKALIRVDFNVPLNERFEVTDSTRIVSAKPTIIKVLEDGGSCILMSHTWAGQNHKNQLFHYDTL